MTGADGNEIGERVSRNGEPTGAVTGSLELLLNLVNALPDGALLAFQRGGLPAFYAALNAGKHITAVTSNGHLNGTGLVSLEHTIVVGGVGSSGNGLYNPATHLGTEGVLVLDPDLCKAYVGENPEVIKLTSAESSLLARLLRADTGVVQREVLVKYVFGDTMARDNSLKKLVHRLRGKVGCVPGYENVIMNIRSVGYRCMVPDKFSGMSESLPNPNIISIGNRFLLHRTENGYGVLYELKQAVAVNNNFPEPVETFGIKEVLSPRDVETLLGHLGIPGIRHASFPRLAGPLRPLFQQPAQQPVPYKNQG